MWKKTIEWLDWNDDRNTFPKWLWAHKWFCNSSSIIGYIIRVSVGSIWFYIIILGLIAFLWLDFDK